ncbi:uncharacterized protein Tco025E_09324 [Trypanosoma conorhini]|uniref:Nodulin-like domain-containing protein n=1 Tax=Trypanosoma conorhini TaxID=83891 RepID=A0A3R7N7Q9_9TRYP|nr:uncharacterized protein Tco025E_09324 [Trypanosoma conorhini]RNE98021.1 hypothetical protein Tco025E_09324 [Trypanosoma conorhini]
MRFWRGQTREVERRRAAGLPAVDEMQRFRLLVCCLFCSICTSLVYAFDLFTTQFVERFHLSVGDQSTISTVGLAFCYFTLPYGFLFDYAGPFPLILICLVTGGLGALLLGLTFDGFIPGSVTNISVFYAMMNTCAGLLDVAYVVTLAEAFPRNLGPVLALAKVLAGLGSSVLASVSVNLFGDNISGFIYAIMAYSVVVCGVAAFVVVLPPYFVNGWRRRGKSVEQLAAMRALEPAYRRKFVPVRRLGVGYAVVALLLVFFTVQAPVVSYTKVSRGASVALGVVTIALVLCFFLMLLPVRWLGGMDSDAEEEPVRLDSAEEGALAGRGNKASPDPADTPDGAASVSDVDSGIPQDPRYGGSVWDNLKRADIWLIFIAFICHSAMGVIVVYNASTISVALTGHKRSQQTSALYTAFLGVSSSVGRMAMGMFEAFVQHQPPDNRRFLVTLALPLAPLLAAVAGLLFLTIPGEAILLPYIIVYFQQGLFTAVAAVIFPSLFASDHGVYYNVGFLTSVLSVIGFNRFLFGYVVDAKHASLGFGPEEECTVAECVRLPLIVATCVAAVGAAFAFLVHIRYSRFVREVRREAEEMD